MFGKRSLRKKIILGYITALLVILVVAIFILLNLIFIEERIKFFTVITRFVDTVLEIRRYEKNFFLYHKKDDLEKLEKYINNAIIILNSNYKKFDSIRLSGIKGFSSEKSTSAVATEMLTRYRMLIQSTIAAKKSWPELQERIRKTGHDITELAEHLSSSERKIIKNTIVSTKRSLIISVIIFFGGTVIIGILVSALVIRPLKELEQNMNSIASGKFEMLSISSNDQEIVSLKNAFERMIKEIFSQRDIIRSEKLTSLGTMLAGIAHEINNPLSNISTSAEILSEELDEDDRVFKKELIDQIIQETDRARDIVRSVLEYTRDRAFRKEAINVSDMISETLRFIRSDIPPYITVQIDVPDELIITVDKQRFQHALLNIIKNAIDSMSDKTQEGRLEIKAYESDKNLVNIEVSDTGVGISKDALQKIFDPFFTTKEVGRGTGLGLFITHNIIKRHHGSISVNSTLDRGTTFTITLPRE